LNGSASGGTSPYTYIWTQTNGQKVTLSDSNIMNPSFTAPDLAMAKTELLTFELSVMDAVGLTAKTSTIVTVFGKTLQQSKCVFLDF